jgi:stearoyl-CoA desaturase (Delta-9 desaturase)
MASASRTLSIPLPNGARISLIGVAPFAIIHLLALGVFFVPFRWSYLITCVALVAVRMFWVSAGYLRYFSHRSFKTSRVFLFVIAFLAMTSAQLGVLWWAGVHRQLHGFSEEEVVLHDDHLLGFLS